MASKSNIPSGDISRLYIDETCEVLVDIWKDGVADDVTARAFCFQFVERALTGPKLTIPVTVNNSGLQRYPGKPQRIGLQITAEMKALLDKPDYKLYLHESTSGQNNPRIVYNYKWLYEPETFIEGQPIEPAVLVLNIITEPESIDVDEIYEGPAGLSALLPVNSFEAMLAIPAPIGRLFYINEAGKEQIVIKDGNKLFALNLIQITPTL